MIITDLEQIKQLAEERYDEFEVMRYQLQCDDDLTDEQIDAIVHRIAEQVRAVVDCKVCANCCLSFDVEVGQDDVDRLHAGTGLRQQQIQSYIQPREEFDPDIIGIFKAKPCPFLRNKLCSVYAHRPTTCSDYPAIYPNFRWLLDYTIAEAAFCPIIYNVLDQMSTKVDDLQRQL